MSPCMGMLKISDLVEAPLMPDFNLYVIWDMVVGYDINTLHNLPNL